MPIVVFLIFLIPSIASAHAVGDVYRLPVPLSYYLLGAGVTVAVSFFALGLLMKRPKNLPRERRLDIPWFPHIIKIGRVLGVFFLTLTIATGIFGTSINFAPIFFWIYFLIGFGVLSLFIGNIWDKINPFKTIADWLGLNIGKYDISTKSVGVFLLLGLYWCELASNVGFFPVAVGIGLLIYTLLSLIYSAFFKDWFQNGEVFSVLFGFIGKLSYLRISDDNRTLFASPPWVGYKTSSWATIYVASILLAVTSFDSVKESQFWYDAIRYFELPFGTIPETIGIILAPIPFFLTYLIAVGIMRLMFGNKYGSFSSLARIFIWSLVPIGFGYTLAHNFSLLISSLPAMYGIISDPFGFGWDLFGTATLRQGGFVLTAKTVWFTEIGFIVLAHIAGIWLAHRIALGIFNDEKNALRSQIPMTVLMVGFTVLTLWLLSLPLVTAPTRDPAPLLEPPPQPPVPPFQ